MASLASLGLGVAVLETSALVVSLRFAAGALGSASATSTLAWVRRRLSLVAVGADVFVGVGPAVVLLGRAETQHAHRVWAQGAALVLALLGFEGWFSRETSSLRKVRAILVTGCVLHAFVLFMVLDALARSQSHAIVGAAVAAGALAGAALSEFLLPLSGSGSAPPGSPGAATAGAAATGATAASALRENIEKKGELSYYVAHANTPTKANINKGGDPVLLQTSRRDSAPEENRPAQNRVTIRKYAFADGKKSVTIYVELASLGLQPSTPESPVHVEVDHATRSVRLAINTRFVMQHNNLSHEIKGARAKLNSAGDRVSVILTKADAGVSWPRLLATSSASK